MKQSDKPEGPCAGGLLIRAEAPALDQSLATKQALLGGLDALDLSESVLLGRGEDKAGHFVRLQLDPARVAEWAPGLDTLALCQRLQLDTVQNSADLQREIVLTMLMGPVAFEFPSMAELVSAVHIRRNIVHAARKTTLAFHTSQAERPQDCWAYKEDCGFVLLPGASLPVALAKATQPDVSGALYSFSCYRATEYVILLGIAEELARCNPDLLMQLQDFWTSRPIMSGEFHETFLREQGSTEQPLPPHYFVPGDRIWFRNPDEASADASGYEGSWVIYLGGGLFSNFWERQQPHSLDAKCLEIYHWRHAVYTDAEGDRRIDEAKVTALMAATRLDEGQTQRILSLMQRYREPRGVYKHGGCLDTTREFARWVHPPTADLVLPPR